MYTSGSLIHTNTHNWLFLLDFINGGNEQNQKDHQRK